MKTIKLKGIKEEIVYEKLDNGLDVYLYCNENISNNYVTFTTKFGSIYHEFVPNGKNKMIRVPRGVAHFLEHKVFVQENDPQPEEFFARSGAVCNAYTTFKNTTYLFSGPNQLNDNICFLLDYVQSPYFTDENVESEKGIITQEIHMCDDTPSDVLYEHIRKNVFYHNPFKDSIIGTVKDINTITKDILFTCYRTFYHPGNMFLVVTGNFDLYEVLSSIKENQKTKKFDSFHPIKIKEYQEPDKVVKSRDVVYMNTPIPKVSYNLKISLSHVDINLRKFNLYLFIIFSCLFDDTSVFDEEAKKEGIITHTTSLNLLNCDSHLLITLINETNFYDEFINKLDKSFRDVHITEEDLERKKRVLISNELFSFENIETINDIIVDNVIFNNTVEDDVIDMIRSLNIAEAHKIIKDINFNNKSIVILKDKEKK